MKCFNGTLVKKVVKLYSLQLVQDHQPQGESHVYKRAALGVSISGMTASLQLGRCSSTTPPRLPCSPSCTQILFSRPAHQVYKRRNSQSHTNTDEHEQARTARVFCVMTQPVAGLLISCECRHCLSHQRINEILTCIFSSKVPAVDSTQNNPHPARVQPKSDFSLGDSFSFSRFNLISRSYNRLRLQGVQLLSPKYSPLAARRHAGNCSCFECNRKEHFSVLSGDKDELLQLSSNSQCLFKDK